MCLIILQPSNTKVIPRSDLRYYASVNRDGIGMMYVENGTVHIYRVLNSVKKFIVRYYEVHEKVGKTSPIVIHFRYATSGKVSLDNCHPFPFTYDTAVVHNGVFSMVAVHESKSDTALWVEIMGPLVGSTFFEDEDEKKQLATLCGESNKLVFLRSDKKVVIVNEAKGEWREDGCWYSNALSNDWSYGATYHLNKEGKWVRERGIHYNYTLTEPHQFRGSFYHERFGGLGDEVVVDGVSRSDETFDLDAEIKKLSNDKSPSDDEQFD